MTPEDRKPFLEILIGFAELKGKQLSAPAMELYWRSMQHWDIESFQAAAEQLLRTCEFMPIPKNFEDLRKAGRPTAGEAWMVALEFARKGYVQWESGPPTRFGSALEPSDPLISRAVAALGGYQAIAMSPTDKTIFLEKRFCEHYEAMQDADEVREAVPEIAFDRVGLKGPQSSGNLLGRFNGKPAP